MPEKLIQLMTDNDRCSPAGTGDTRHRSVSPDTSAPWWLRAGQPDEVEF